VERRFRSTSQQLRRDEVRNRTEGHPIRTETHAPLRTFSVCHVARERRGRRSCDLAFRLGLKENRRKFFCRKFLTRFFVRTLSLRRRGQGEVDRRLAMHARTMLIVRQFTKTLTLFLMLKRCCC